MVAYSHIQMTASEKEASPTSNRKKDLAVEIKILRDGIGSDHTEKPARIHRGLTQGHCKGATRKSDAVKVVFEPVLRICSSACLRHFWELKWV